MRNRRAWCWGVQRRVGCAAAERADLEAIVVVDTDGREALAEQDVRGAVAIDVDQLLRRVDVVQRCAALQALADEEVVRNLEEEHPEPAGRRVLEEAAVAVPDEDRPPVGLHTRRRRIAELVEAPAA